MGKEELLADEQSADQQDRDLEDDQTGLETLNQHHEKASVNYAANSLVLCLVAVPGPGQQLDMPRAAADLDHLAGSVTLRKRGSVWSP